ncbi:MAG TPA: hypothetical protein VMO47_11455 [Rhodothermales bacterium]|nr:hypothetical protein [Rhodothermales bacterium]
MRDNRPLRCIPWLLLICLAATTAAGQDTKTSVRAFPGAEGFGAFTVGGRGGHVYIVTSLEDYDLDEEEIHGSLRQAVEAAGPRTVVFGVSGYIELKRPLEVVHPFLTIAGQPAPGDGVALRNYGLEVGAGQVIIRYLRVRPGDVSGIEQDAINIRAPDVIVDHCSVSWGTDEVLSVIGHATNVTVQWCLISESLNNSVHHKGAHGYGTLLTASGNVSIHHTVYALHNSRNPRPKDLLLDFRNNLIYGFGDQAGYNYEDQTRMNYVGNVIRPLDYSKNPRCAFNLGGLNSRFFVRDNLFLANDTISGDWEFICTPDTIPRSAVDEKVKLAAPIDVAEVATDAPLSALYRLMSESGAMLPTRDAVDRRVLDFISTGGGRIIDSQYEVGGWLPLAPGELHPDNDRDGMPDGWESSNGLDPADGSDHALDPDRDGYTNIEEFLNGTNPQSPD